jgi:hypothetical protein
MVGVELLVKPYSLYFRGVEKKNKQYIKPKTLHLVIECKNLLFQIIKHFDFF